MTNPGDAIGTNGAYGGRTSVNAFNDILSVFSGPGIVQGWACKPNSGLTVSLGGADGVRDVAIAENDIGQRTTIDNISVQPVDITLTEAPTLGARIDAIVAYVNNPPEIDESTIQPPVDNPGVCGIIAVSGSVATTPTAPTENMIREAITADGASGVSAYYVVLATVSVGTGVSVITANDITAGPIALVENASVPDGSITSDKLDWSTITKLTPVSFPVTIGSVKTTVPGYRIEFGNGMTAIGCASSPTARPTTATSSTTEFSLEYGIEFEEMYVGSMNACSTATPGTHLMFNNFGPTKTDSYMNRTSNTPLLISLFLLGKV